MILVPRYQVRCPELRYRLAPIEEYRGRENASAVLYFADVRIEVSYCVYCRIEVFEDFYFRLDMTNISSLKCPDFLLL